MKKSFNWRVSATILVTCCFGIMTVSGIILYLTPAGRVANWTGWTLLGLTKDEWQAVHTITALVFIAGAGVHLYYNWRPFLHYFRKRTSTSASNWREIAAATVLSLAVCAGTLANMAPFLTIMQWNADIKDYWDARTAHAVAYPHAEYSTVAEFSERMGIEIERVKANLAARGVEVQDPERDTLGALAEEAQTTPEQLVSGLLPPRSGGVREPGSGQGAGRGDGVGHGAGQRDGMGTGAGRGLGLGGGQGERGQGLGDGRGQGSGQSEAGGQGLGRDGGRGLGLGGGQGLGQRLAPGGPEMD